MNVDIILGWLGKNRDGNDEKYEEDRDPIHDKEQQILEPEKAPDPDRVLVTGSTGFLGGNIVKHLLAAKYKVRCIVRNEAVAKTILPEEVEIAQGDVTDLDSLLAAAQDCDVIIHAAALVQAWSKDPSLFEKVNVGGLRNVIEVLKVTKSIMKLVFISSIFALGPSDGSTANEDQIHPGKEFFTPYERTKWQADLVAREAVSEGLPISIVYPGVIYGPGQLTNGNLIVKMILDHSAGKLPGLIGSGQQLWSFVYVDDVSNGVIASLEKGAIGGRHLLAGDNRTFVDVFEIVATLTGKPAPKLRLPVPLVKTIGFLSVIVAHIAKEPPVFTHESAEAFNHDWAFSSLKAEEELGYNYRKLEEGLKETLAWLKDTNQI